MSATPRAGRNARILIDVSSGHTGALTKVSGKNKWSVDQSANPIETTEFEALSKTYVQDLPDGKGSLDGTWDSADTSIYNLIADSVARAFYLYPDVTNNAGTYWFCTAFFSAKGDGDVKGTVNFGLTFVAATPGQWIHP